MNDDRGTLIPLALAALVIVLGLMVGCRTYKWQHVESDGSYDVLTVQIPPTDTSAGKLHFEMTKHGPTVTAESLSLEDRQADIIGKAVDALVQTSEAAR